MNILVSMKTKYLKMVLETTTETSYKLKMYTIFAVIHTPTSIGDMRF